VIVYEYPLNERIRTWLRLEDLFEKTAFFIRADDPRSHHAALLSIFELVDIMARPELRSELLQELERQKLAFEPFRGNPAVDPIRLEEVLEILNHSLSELHAQTGKLGQHIRDNEWLSSIKSRTCIPGGVCDFDLPSYHYWLNQPSARRRDDLLAWLTPLRTIGDGVEVVLKLLRESGNVMHCTAQSGLFQLMLGGRVAQLLRVGVEDGMPCLPEVSANKYAVNVRFVATGTSQKSRTYEENVAFELVFCSFAGIGPA
jgi:cell division protein ZapD